MVNADGILNQPAGIIHDQVSSLYVVADTFNHRIQTLDDNLTNSFEHKLEEIEKQIKPSEIKSVNPKLL